ncbi:hypothetical protein [uncultured Jannaschia sp.]|uniref:hypothetical protein n=1 Tax=uncultured Jannaschia sp. TaxID=293347 RepID=UPI002638F1A0|nr:hypothetical protein [uncultured Jannaschia sp.]
MPLHISALRALGAFGNVVEREGVIDELVILAWAGSIAFRPRHLHDPRAIAVIERAAREFGWSSGSLPLNGGGSFASVRFKSIATYLPSASGSSPRAGASR